MKKFYAILAVVRTIIAIVVILPFVALAWVTAAVRYACKGPIWLTQKAFQLTDRFVYWY